MKLLLIDDDELSLKMLFNALVLNGYDCCAFSDPVKAVDSFLRESYNIIICDYKMPEFNGLDVLGFIKASGRDTDFILYSAFANDKIAKEAIEQGAAAFYYKPIHLDCIVKHINEYSKKSKHFS